MSVVIRLKVPIEMHYAVIPMGTSKVNSSRLVMTDCPLSGRGQGHVSNFYIFDLENFATASHQCTGAINKLNKLVYGQLVDYTYDGRVRHAHVSYKLVD